MLHTRGRLGAREPRAGTVRRHRHERPPSPRPTQLAGSRGGPHYDCWDGVFPLRNCDRRCARRGLRLRHTMLVGALISFLPFISVAASPVVARSFTRPLRILGVAHPAGKGAGCLASLVVESHRAAICSLLAPLREPRQKLQKVPAPRRAEWRLRCRLGARGAGAADAREASRAGCRP